MGIELVSNVVLRKDGDWVKKCMLYDIEGVRGGQGRCGGGGR